MRAFAVFGGSSPTARFAGIAFAVASGLFVSPLPAQAAEAYLVGAGDIAKCGDKYMRNAEATARLLDRFFENLNGEEAVVFTAGDTAYKRGRTEEFSDCYDPTWGRHKERTRPAVGNHEYKTRDAAPYYAYFGDRAGDPKQGYYSYELGDWHIVVLNTVCKKVGGCDEGSPQYEWLLSDLEQNDKRCVLAYSHHPMFSSGKHGGEKAVRPLFRLLHQNGAEAFVSGHDHNYERFAPQDPEGKADSEHGVRQFVVGTGGRELRRVGRASANSEVLSREAYGVISFRLLPDSYEWEFHPIAGEQFTDSGEGVCR